MISAVTENKDLIWERLDFISSEVEKKMELIINNDSKTAYKEMSVFGGYWGMLLFLGYYAKYKNKKDIYERWEYFLNYGLEQLGEGIFFPTYCNGVAGIFFTLQHLIENHFIQVDITEAEDHYQQFISNSLQEFLEAENYDFLHGAIGIGFYFLNSKTNPDFCIQNLKKILKHLEHSSIRDGDIIKWKYKSEDFVYNISLSHGMSSIVIFLSRLLARNIETERTKHLLKGSIRFILTQRMDFHTYGSCFPSSSLEDNDKVMSRLGWCYGDLGVAMALMEAGTTCNNPEWNSIANEVFSLNTSRKTFEQTKIGDPCICHGSAGIAQIYRRLYFKTSNPEYLEFSQYWIQWTLKKAIQESPGFYIEPKTYEYHQELAFLMGTSGIGLSLLAAITDESASGWDKLLLLH